MKNLETPGKTGRVGRYDINNLCQAVITVLYEVYKYRVDKPSRSRACFSFALTGISF